VPAGIIAAPLEEAVKRLSSKTPIGSALRSADWEGMPAKLRKESFQSAGVESVRVLSTMHGKLLKRLAMATEVVGQQADGTPKVAFVNRDSFIADMKRMVADEGLGTGRGGLTDIRSNVRLGLIFDMQTRMHTGEARWRMDQDPDVLNSYPAQRLVRERSAKSPRDWMSRWQDAGERVNWVGASRTEMVAMKTSPIWVELSRFKTPWPPFDYGSGMGTEDVAREEAIAIGLMQEADTIQPVADSFDAGLEESVAGLAKPFIDQLKKFFGNQLVVSGDKVSWRDRKR
jgi:hypothetical protein